ncbi:MAG: DNA-binding protein [Cypionkella sp.]|nr:DNA-binding protein [Cypionkella sp.]
MVTKSASAEPAPKTLKSKTAAGSVTAKSAAAKTARVAKKSEAAAVAVKSQVAGKNMNEIAEIADTDAKAVAQMKVRDLIERVAGSVEQNKKDVRTIVEATLVELGKAMEAGESLNLPPFGRVRIANQKADATGQLLTLKLRRGGEKKPGKNAGKEALAGAGEAS